MAQSTVERAVRSAAAIPEGASMPLLTRLAVLLAVPALAACRVAKDTASGDPRRWHFFAVANGDSSFIDQQTLRDSAGVRRVWIRTTTIGPTGQPIEPIQYEFNCTAGKARAWAKAASGSGQGEWTPWQPVAPASYAATALEAVCALAPAADPT
jgi:hypothetical protein